MFYTVKEVAKKLDITEDAVKYLCSAGIIPHRRIGVRYLFDEEAYKWIQAYYKPRKKKCGRKKRG